MKKWLLILLVLLSGCTSTGISQSSKPKPDQGLVFASVLFAGTYSENSIYIRKIGEAEFVRMGLGEAMILVPVFPKSDFEDLGYDKLGKKGAVLAEALPPGDYEVFDWRVVAGSRTLRARKPFSIPFTVVQGKVAYIGSYHFTHQGYLVGSVTANAKDLFERDAKIFDSKFKDYQPLEKQNQAPAEAMLNLGGGSTSVMNLPMPIFVPR
ncbi:MAG: hypothetical protein EOP38_13145 [Rubrivivax sp.]|nr:MAG: hypothetical protein EOP38_13145 [Rubrivivax sp.]